MKPDYKKLFYRKLGQQEITLELMEEKAKTMEAMAQSLDAMAQSLDAMAKSMNDMSQAFSACVVRLKKIQEEDTGKFNVFEDEV